MTETYDNERDLIWAGWEWALFPGVAWYGRVVHSSRKITGCMVETPWPRESMYAETVSDLFYADDAPHPHDTKCPGLAGLLTREEYDAMAVEAFEYDD